VVDVLIRGLSPEAVARLDEAAAAQGLSRSEYLRRRFEQEAPLDPSVVVTMADLRRAAAAASDLLDDDVMRQAWS